MHEDAEGVQIGGARVVGGGEESGHSAYLEVPTAVGKNQKDQNVISKKGGRATPCPRASYREWSKRI